jgi:integrase
MAIYYDKQRKAWVADYSVKTNESRKRRRKFFATKSEASACLASQKYQKKKYGEATEFDLVDYQRLKQLEQSVTGGSLEDAVRSYNALSMGGNSITLRDAVKRYLEQKECSKEHLVNLRIYLGKFVNNLGDVKVKEIQAKNIHYILKKMDYTMVYKNNMRRAFVTFFNYCIFNQFAVSNEAEKVPLFTEEKSEIEFISVEQARRLFEVLEESYPYLIPYNAFRAFAGIRTAHAKTMTWSQINFEERGIRFNGGGKRISSYLEDYPHTLWAWLESYKTHKIKLNDAKETNKVMRSHNIECPHNGLRHGFATYHLAKYKDINLTSILLMHRGNPRMLFDRYRGVTSACASDEYFEILPRA